MQEATAAVPVKMVRVQSPASSADAGEQVILTATGYIVAAHKIEVASKVIGPVAWIGVDKGDKVKAGQVLVRLEDDEYRAQFSRRKASSRICRRGWQNCRTARGRKKSPKRALM